MENGVFGMRKRKDGKCVMGHGITTQGCCGDASAVPPSET